MTNDAAGGAAGPRPLHQDELRRLPRLRREGRRWARTSPTATGATAARRRRSSTRSTKAVRRACRPGTRRLPPQDIWKLVAYIQSLGGSYPAAQYQAWLQGDQHGDNVAAEVAATCRPAQPRARPSRRAAPPTRRASRRKPTSRRRRAPASEAVADCAARSRALRRAAARRAEPAMSYLHTFGPAGDPATRLGWGLGIVSIVVVVDHHRAAARGHAAPARAGRRPGGARRRIATRAACRGSTSASASRRWCCRLRGLDDVHGGRGGDAGADRADAAGHRGAVVVERALREQRARPRSSPPPTRSTSRSAGPVRVELTSQDVIHSFWIPQLAGKMDIIPGQTNVTWLQADRPGIYRGQCSEYCGAQHAHMALYVVADTPQDFAAWRDATSCATRPRRPPTRRGSASRCSRRTAPPATPCAAPTAGGILGPDLTHLMSRHDHRRRPAAQHAAATSPAGSPIRRRSSPARACRRSPCPGRDLSAVVDLPADAALRRRDDGRYRRPARSRHRPAGRRREHRAAPAAHLGDARPAGSAGSRRSTTRRSASATSSPRSSS